jgi:hypothetical protein
LYTTKAFVLLDGEGKRLAAKYYSYEWPTLEKQVLFEKVLWTKSQAHAAGTTACPKHSYFLSRTNRRVASFFPFS